VREPQFIDNGSPNTTDDETSFADNYEFKIEDIIGYPLPRITPVDSEDDD